MAAGRSWRPPCRPDAASASRPAGYRPRDTEALAESGTAYRGDNEQGEPYHDDLAAHEDEHVFGDDDDEGDHEGEDDGCRRDHVGQTGRDDGYEDDAEDGDHTDEDDSYEDAFDEGDPGEDLDDDAFDHERVLRRR